jgi:Paraquat-inducible protein A
VGALLKFDGPVGISGKSCLISGLYSSPVCAFGANLRFLSQVSSHFIVMYQRRIEASAVAKYSATTIKVNKEITDSVDGEHDQLHFDFNRYDEDDLNLQDRTHQIDVDVDGSTGLNNNTSLSDELDKPEQYNGVDIEPVANGNRSPIDEVPDELAIMLFDVDSSTGPSNKTSLSDEINKSDQYNVVDLEPGISGNVCPLDEGPDELSMMQNEANLDHDIESGSDEQQRESVIESSDTLDASDIFEPDTNGDHSGKTANDSDLQSSLEIKDLDCKNIGLNDALFVDHVAELNGEICDAAIDSNANDFPADIDCDEPDLNPVLELHDEIIEPICMWNNEHPTPNAESSEENLDSVIETCEEDPLQLPLAKHNESAKPPEPVTESATDQQLESDADLYDQQYLSSTKPPGPVTEVNDMSHAGSVTEQQLDLDADWYDQQYLDSSVKNPNLNQLKLADKSLESSIIESIYDNLELPVLKKSSNHNLEPLFIDDLNDGNNTDESAAIFIDHHAEKDSTKLEPSENKNTKELVFETTDGSTTDLAEQDLSAPEDKEGVQFEKNVPQVVGREPVIIKPNAGDDEIPINDVPDSKKKSESDDAFLQPQCFSKREALPTACTNSTATSGVNSNFESCRELQLPALPKVDGPIVCFSTRDLILPDECFYSISVAHGSDSLDSDYNYNDDDKFNETMDAAAFVPGENDDNAVALFQCIFYRAHHTGRHVADDGLVVPEVANQLLVLAAMASAALFLAGSILPSFTTESQGLVGIVIGLGGSSTVEHGIFSVAKTLISMTEYFNTTKDKIGLWSIVVLFVVTAVLVPIVLVMLYLVRWFYPMTDKSSRGLEVWIEALEAWQYVEVLVVTILLSVWQLGDISEFLMNKQCDSFESFFATMSHFQILTPQEAQCFKLQPTVEIGTYILVAATISLSFLRTWMALAVRQVKYQEQFRYLTTRERNDSSAVPLADAEMTSGDGMTKDATILLNAIAPFPILFTDQFRWLMVEK